MKNRDDALLRKISEYCNESSSAVEMFGNDYSIFSNNVIYRNACCMPIMQIGELCKLISEFVKEQYPEIDWKGWCGVRDIMAHQYSNLDFQKTWQIVSIDLPKLKVKIDEILKILDGDNISRIVKILKDNNIINLSAETIYNEIITNTGISLNAFSNEKLLEFIKSNQMEQ